MAISHRRSKSQPERSPDRPQERALYTISCAQHTFTPLATVVSLVVYSEMRFDERGGALERQRH